MCAVFVDSVGAFSVAPRENGFFFGEATLCEFAFGALGSSEVKHRAKCELLVRYLLARRHYQGTALEDRLVSWLGQSLLNEVGQLFHDIEYGLEGRRLVDLDGFLANSDLPAGAVKELYRALSHCLEEVDGYIPVYSKSPERAYLLPFHFKERPEGARPKVVDLKGREFAPEWSEHLAQLDGITGDVCVKMIWSESLPEFDGESLMLPLQMAWWRHANRSFPNYSVHRFLATGAVSGGRLKCVHVERKKEHIEKTRDDFFFVYPVVGRGAGEGELPEGLPLSECREKIAWWALWHTPLNADRAFRQLEAMACAEGGGGLDNWSEVYQRLEEIANHCDRKLDPKRWFANRLQCCFAACHCGETQAAEMAAREAEFFAREKPQYRADLLRLRIQQAIMLQDQYRFRAATELLDEVERALASGEVALNQEQLADLRMRLYGTRGQLLSIRCLRGEPEVGENAFESLQQAKEIAEHLSDQEVGTNRRGALKQVVRDANYLVWYAALCDFSLLQPAEKMARELAAKLSQEDADRNGAYRELYFALGYYLRLLRDGATDGFREPAAQLVGRGEKWLQAMIGKYCGAIAAARGHLDKASELFDKAESLLPPCSGGMLDLLHLSLECETIRSLRNTPFAGQAVAARTRADALLPKVQVADEARREWSDWIHSPDTADFPGKTFWY